MARARNLKPGFFKNEELFDLGPWCQLCFAGLWTLADREGRLEDRPRRIKAELFPYYDDQDGLVMDQWLTSLNNTGFITRYEVGQEKYIQINNFDKHQNPHIKEAESTIPAPDQPHTKTPDSLNPLTDSLNPIKDQPKKVDRFPEFWEVYPKKVGKKPTKGKWKAKKLDSIADRIIEDVKIRVHEDEGWRDGYIPNPLTYINQERWDDEIRKKQTHQEKIH